MADRTTLSLYLLVNAAAATRVVAPFLGDAYVPLLTISALLWTGAFGGFALVYGPMLAKARGLKS